MESVRSSRRYGRWGGKFVFKIRKRLCGLCLIRKIFPKHCTTILKEICEWPWKWKIYGAPFPPLDLLYFMLPSMRHPIVLTNFSIVHGTFCFFTFNITNLACQSDNFLLLLSKGQLCKFRLSKFCFQHPSSCIRLRSTSFRNPLKENVVGAANLYRHPHGNCRNKPSSRVE